jgi:transmembrane sensor
MDADMENVRAYEARETAWHLAEDLRGRKEFEALLADADRIRATARPSALWTWIAAHRLRVSALVALPAVCVLVFWLSTLTGTSAEYYETGVGEQRVVKLADQSIVNLNAATRLRVAYSRHLRSVELLGGEALFDVVHDTGRPFEVRADGGTTRAVGTRFDVRMRPGSTEVAVLSGAVDVSPPVDARTRKLVRVARGESVVYMPDGSVTVPTPLDQNRIAGWQAGKFVLSHATLREAVAESNRYNRTPVVLEAPQYGDRQISGIFRIGDVEAFVTALERALPLRAEHRKEQIVLLPGDRGDPAHAD